MFIIEFDKIRVLPYDNLTSFFEEYLFHCDSVKENNEEIAKRSTFIKAYQELEKTEFIRLTGCKGSFNTCEICNNSNDLLRDRGKSFEYFFQS